MTIALHGNLRDFGMGEVFQLIGQQRKTGVLEVRGQNREVTLRFDAGCVVSASPVGESPNAALVDMIARCGFAPRDRVALFEHGADPTSAIGRRIVEAGVLDGGSLREVEDLLTRETIFELLRWSDGSFRFVSQSIAHDRPADSLLGAEQVLMDGLRMVDEWRAFASELPDELAVFRRRGSIEEYRHSMAGHAALSPVESERVFLLVDGRATVRRVIDLSRLGSFGAMRILVQLARAGWIEPVRARSSTDVGTPAPDPSLPLRRRIALVAPFVLLACVAALGFARGPADGGGLEVASDVLGSARARFAVVRTRALLLAHRVAVGRWPAGLDALAEWTQDGAVALTPAERDAYYVGARSEGPLVLAPDPVDLGAVDRGER